MSSKYVSKRSICSRGVALSTKSTNEAAANSDRFAGLDGPCCTLIGWGSLLRMPGSPT